MDGGPINSSTPPLSALAAKMSGPRSRAWDVTNRAAEMARDGREIIHLGVGDPDFDTPPDIVDVAVKAAQNSRTHYSPIPGEWDLRCAIAESSSEQLDVPVSAEQVIIFPGAQCALFATMMCLSGPGDEVILLEPFYATYDGVACAGGADFVTVPMPADTNFQLDVGRIADAITDRTRVILANSPGNPSGAVFDQDSWQALAELCRSRNIWLISDEVYSNLVFDGEHHSPFSLQDVQDRVVVVNSVSKTFAMTGWRLGWTISSPEVATHLDNLAQYLLFGVNQFTQDAAAYALRHPPAETGRMKTAFRERREVLCHALEKIDGLVVHEPAGGMFTMVDVSALGCDGEAFANGLLDQHGVAVVPGFGFGDSVRNCVRIGYLHDVAILRKAADKIQRFVDGFRS
jgi:arginine:pyruvate transaminase